MKKNRYLILAILALHLLGLQVSFADDKDFPRIMFYSITSFDGRMMQQAE